MKNKLSIRKTQNDYYKQNQQQYSNPQQQLQEAKRLLQERSKKQISSIHIPIIQQNQLKSQVKEQQSLAIKNQIAEVTQFKQKMSILIKGVKVQNSKYKGIIQHAIKASQVYLLNLYTYLLVSYNSKLLKSDLLMKNLSILKHNFDDYKVLLKKLKPLMKKQRKQLNLQTKQIQKLTSNKQDKDYGIEQEWNQQQQKKQYDSDLELILGNQKEQHYVYQQSQNIQQNPLDQIQQLLGQKIYLTKKKQIKKQQTLKKKKHDQAKKQAISKVFQKHQIMQVKQNQGRKINSTIERNKGMTRIRKRIDRNSRVKLRKKYQKALKDPKIKLQQVRDPLYQQYTGQLTGAKTARIRSVKY